MYICFVNFILFCQFKYALINACQPGLLQWLDQNILIEIEGYDRNNCRKEHIVAYLPYLLSWTKLKIETVTYSTVNNGLFNDITSYFIHQDVFSRSRLISRF